MTTSAKLALGWRTGLEPATTGITIQGSTNWATNTITTDFYKLVRPEGFEPPTTDFASQYSIQLSYGRMVGDEGLEPPDGGIKIRCLTNLANPQLYGPSGEVRTPDPLLPKQMRSQAALHSDEFGGGNRDRTCDLRLAKPPLSQLSYTPNYFRSFASTQVSPLKI